ncbi:MAG: serine/threonine-protein kinase [Actinomycetota bacterium]
MTTTEGEAPPARFIGPYRVIALIGVGASSTVYRAVRPADGLQVAVKLLADNHSVLAESRRRFADEARVMTGVVHPAIAEVYEVAETDGGQPYLVMELADRGDLRARVGHLESVGYRLTADDVRTVALQLAQGLTALHDHEVVHRDLSPANLLIRHDRIRDDRPPTASTSLLEPSEKLLLADLGFAKILQDGSGLTRGGGTAGFSPPEQRTAVSQVDHRADVYSATAIVDWLAHQADLTAAIEPFLVTGMAEDPARRHDDMTAWFSDLDLRLGLGADADAPATQGRPWSVVAAVVGAVCLLVAGLVGAMALQADDGDETTATTPSDDDGGTTATDPAEGDGGAGSDDTGEAADQATGAVTDLDATATGADDEAGTPPTVATTTAAPSPTTGPATTASPSTPTTAAASTTTAPGGTTENPFPFSPRSYIVSPREAAAIGGDLRITGTATAPVTGVGLIQLTIRNEDEGTYWNPDLGRFTTEFIRFDVPVDDPGAVDVTWNYRIPAADLTPGPHRLRTWARGTDDSGDPLSSIVNVEITG